MTENCPLCTIPINETLLYEDDSVYLVSTKDNKSHKVRVMAVTKRHTTEPTFEEITLAYGILINHMTNLMLNQDWYIVDGTFASVPQHFHILACDIPLEEEEDPFFVKTPKIVFPIRERR